MSRNNEIIIELLKNRRKRKIKRTLGICLCIFIIILVFAMMVGVLGFYGAVIILSLGILVGALEVLLKWLLD